jgi:3',5'-cyclic AMP phosphodiesterase CpdA
MQNTEPDALRIAVISDVHATSKQGDVSRSHCKMDPAFSGKLHNPLSGLVDLAERGDLAADLILCPGDLADHAEPSATTFAWKKINELATSLSNCRVIATAGNHDVDSRHEHSKFDGRGLLQSLIPRFPVQDEGLYDRYWSRHFVTIEDDRYRILVLNSSAYHGTSDAKDRRGNSVPEYEHGRISDYTLDAIRDELENSNTKEINILLCHHHPHQHSEHGLGELDVMQGGQRLIELLGNSRFGSWLIVHGHKHHPKISYAAGPTSATPVVFAAGSVSAFLYPELATHTRNQFHLLELSRSEIKKFGLVGKFSSWDWSSGIGWIPAQSSMGLPRSGGFGNRTQMPLIVESLLGHLKNPSMKWRELCSSMPELAYLLPSDLQTLTRCLEENHKISFLQNKNGEIERVEKLHDTV